MDLRLARHAFVTGGASGLGLAMGRAFAAHGLAVTLADMDEEGLTKARNGLSSRVGVQRLDTREREEWSRAKADAEDEFGPVDIIVNCAGIGPNGREFANMSPESFDRILAVNLTGVFNGVSAFAADMRDRGRGYIVNVSSLAGLAIVGPGLGAYTVAKYGVVALSETLARELRPHGVGVSVLCPGYVHTNIFVSTLIERGVSRKEAERTPPPPASINADEVAKMVLAAMAADRLFIITHPGGWPVIEDRFKELRTACDEASASQPRPC